jgi:CDP-6-deoxy-D-xylo-4-hexulose-3-dehydrase
MLSLVTHTWDDLENEAIKKLLVQKNLTMGENVRLFEEQFASFVGSTYAVMVNSGSSANLLSVASLFYCNNPLKPGDEVIVPAVSWATTYSPLHQYNLKLKFVDINLDTINIDLDKLVDAVSPATKLIVAVNVIGNPIDFDRLLNIIECKNAEFSALDESYRPMRLIEDNCESLGASINGKQTGTFGLLGTFSTYFSHHISTIEGGVVVTDDLELYHILLSLRSHGWTRHLPVDTKICVKNEDKFYDLFNFILPGYNVRPTDIAGAVGIEQLKKLPSIIEYRRNNGQLFKKLFSDIIKIQQETGKSSWFGFVLILPNKSLKDKLVERLNNHSIECRPVVAGNFCRNPTIKFYNYTIHDNLENSDIIHERAIYIGNHHTDISKELHVLRDIVVACLN